MSRLTKTAGAAMLAALVLMTGCNKSEVHTGGEGTNFPYTWQENKGAVSVTLDGSYAPEYSWIVESTDDTVLKVSASGKEKKGRISYKITPLKEGTANVIFTRIRETGVSNESAETDTYDTAETEAVSSKPDVPKPDKPEIKPMEVENVTGGFKITGGEEAGDGENSSEDGVAGDTSGGGENDSESEAQMPDAEQDSNWENLQKAYTERMQVKDVVSEVTFMFDVSPSGKNGKLETSVISQFGVESAGLMRSEDESIPYKLWFDSTGTLMVRLPFNKESWVPACDDKFIAVSRLGAVDGDECFEIRQAASGKATVVFSAATYDKRFVLELNLSEQGNLSVISHRLENR